MHNQQNIEQKFWLILIHLVNISVCHAAQHTEPFNNHYQIIAAATKNWTSLKCHYLENFFKKVM